MVPKISTPYLLGSMSYYSGLPRINNPYPVDSEEHREWNRGYDDAKKEKERWKKDE